MRSLCCFQLEQDSIEGAKQPIVCRHQKSTASTPHYSWEPRFHGYCTRGLPAVGSKSKPKNVENQWFPVRNMVDINGGFSYALPAWSCSISMTWLMTLYDNQCQLSMTLWQWSTHFHKDWHLYHQFRYCLWNMFQTNDQADTLLRCWILEEDCVQKYFSGVLSGARKKSVQSGRKSVQSGRQGTHLSLN